MFVIAYLCEFHTYTWDGKHIGVPLLSIFLGVIVGFCWELYQVEYQNSWKVDLYDIIRTAVGFLLGGLAGTFLFY